MMNNEWIVVGRFGRVHGIKGFITVHSFTEPRENILHYSDWHILVNKKWQPVEILKVEVHSKSIIALIKGYDQRESASSLINAEIAVSRDQLPTPDTGEYYWHDLMGLQVIDQQHKTLGIVVDMMSTGSNDVLVVMGEKRILIPYLPELVIKKVDLESKQIEVDWDADF